MKQAIKWGGILLAVIIVIIIGYISYLFIDYHRLEDNLTLEAENNNTEILTADQTYQAMTFNIGYGAYTADYTFFMDGGKSARAKDQETVEANMAGVENITKEIDPTIAFFQEVDQNGDRSRHVDEVASLEKAFPDYSNVYGQNYDSSYLFYPILEPIGKAKSGLVTLSRSAINDATRYSLPIETNLNKFFDLDRAFTVSKIPVNNNKELIAINAHLSAYTKDPAVQEAQMTKLFGIIADEYAKGNYVIVGGDFNHDILGNSPEIFQTKADRHSWDQPFPEADLPEGFQIPKGTMAEDAIPSTRKLDIPYEKGVSYVSILDGFILSDNISVSQLHVIDAAFDYSDHNPVVMDFKLNP